MWAYQPKEVRVIYSFQALFLLCRGKVKIQSIEWFETDWVGGFLWYWINIILHGRIKDPQKDIWAVQL